MPARVGFEIVKSSSGRAPLAAASARATRVGERSSGTRVENITGPLNGAG
jgi:hypothetical protein